MSYDEQLANRVREALLIYTTEIEEKKMFSGLCFMVKGKMCVCISKDELMCRIGPEATATALERNDCRPMIHGGRSLNDYVYVAPEGYKSRKDFDGWIAAAMAFNGQAKASKKKA
ncbi:TfoX/Sxy family protein [Taibaiella koreensis]|uniref:TfoX/Sxy family protein n=1 Tax=Taibaiella koreensis TaxID=1268548 RepID=UPI000E599783|nr:TfoX/Sxy family protein [Taibaiella koreensis]